MSDTIIVLGAGFSAPAQMPVQVDLMREIVKRRSQVGVRNAIGSLFNIVEMGDMAQVPLEDIFTMLDRARNARETIPGFSREQVEESLKLLLSSIAEEFKRRLSSFRRDCYETFFSELIKTRVDNGSENACQSSPFAVFTLNWDTLPDYFIWQLGSTKNVDVDYGCSIHPLSENKTSFPTQQYHAPDLFTIKLMKLHGSLHWLTCSSCGRLFSSIDFAESPPVLCGESRECGFCKNVLLRSVLITPTILKEFNNVHLAMIWHKALLELREARRLLFVGYSLPMADFEFRYLLLRGIAARHDVIIRVVLYPPEDRINDQRQRFERLEVEQRYRRFFGDRDIEFEYMDAADFMVKPVRIWNW